MGWGWVWAVCFLSLFWAPVQTSRILVLKSGKAIACDSFEVSEGRVTFFRKNQSFSIPESMVNWSASERAEKEAEERREQLKAETPEPEPLPQKPKEPITLTNDQYREMAQDSRSGPVTSSFRRMGNHVVVQTVIDGQGPFDFVLDTGAAVTIISPEIAGRLGITPLDEAVNVVGVAGNAVSASYGRVRELSLAGARVDDLKVVIKAIPQLNQAGVEGLLGQDYLDHFVLSLNSAGLTLTLTPHGAGHLRHSLADSYAEALDDTQSVFRDLDEVTRDLVGLVEVFMTLSPQRENTGHIRDLKRISEKLPGIHHRMGDFYDALSAYPHETAEPETRENIEHFLRCYSHLDGYLRQIQKFSRSLRGAFANTRDPSALNEKKALINDEWGKVQKSYGDFDGCR